MLLKNIFVWVFFLICMRRYFILSPVCCVYSISSSLHYIQVVFNIRLISVYLKNIDVLVKFLRFVTLIVVYMRVRVCVIYFYIVWFIYLYIQSIHCCCFYVFSKFWLPSSVVGVKQNGLLWVLPTGGDNMSGDKMFLPNFYSLLSF